MGAFGCWAEALACLPPRVITQRVTHLFYVLYTDASFENDRGHLAAVLFNVKTGDRPKRAIDTIIPPTPLPPGK